MNDNFTFYLYNIPNDWDYTFSPSIASLSPNESMDVKLKITTSDTAQAGNYSIFPTIISQYYSQTINTLIHSGSSNSTEYHYAIWNGSDFPDDFYEINYNDSMWEVGAAPFGNDELRGIEPNTLWQTDDTNYTYITARHWLNYTGSLDFSELRIKIAHDDYYKVYLNEKLIRDCFSGWGCGGDGRYWEDTITINSSWLNNGNNLIHYTILHSPDHSDKSNIINYLIERGANIEEENNEGITCLLYTSPSPRDGLLSRMPSSA